MSRKSGAAGMNRLREAFSAATLRAAMGIADAGRVFLGVLRNAEGAVVDSDGKDVLVRLVDVLTEHPLMARLHIPANILWRKPRSGETVTVLRPADLGSPGTATALYGDAGADGAVPPWYDTKAGIYSPETARVESKDGDVELEVSGARQVKLGAAATKRVNRQGDAIEPGTLTITAVTVGTVTTITTTYAPPGGPPQMIVYTLTGAVAAAQAPPTTATLGGRTGPGSNKVRAED